MRYRVVILVGCVVIGLGGLAQAADQPEAFVSGPAVVSCSSAALQAETKGGGPFESYCVADCGEHPDVDCNGATCSAVNRNCSSYQRGYVVCDGSYTYCPSCPECVDGQFWFNYTGDCCDEGLEEFERYKCVNEQWVLLFSGCRPSPQCPILP